MDLSPTVFLPAAAVPDGPWTAAPGSLAVAVAVPDWTMLVALTGARQAASRTAQVQARLAAGRAMPRGGAFAARVAAQLAGWKA